MQLSEETNNITGESTVEISIVKSRREATELTRKLIYPHDIGSISRILALEARKFTESPSA